MRKSRHLAAALAIFMILAPAFTTAALANSLTATSPTAGSVLSVAPNAISMTTANPLLDQGNLIVVNDPNGVAVYTVNYTVLAANEAPVAGSFTFQFKAPSVVSAPSTPAVSPSTSKKAVSSQSTNSGADTFVYVLLLLAFLVFVFLIIYAKQTFGGSKKRSRN